MLENAHSEAAVNQEAPATIPEDVVTTEHNDERECTAYVCGKVKLALFDDSEDGWVGYLDALDRTADFKASGIAELRALSYLLEHPDIRRLIGRDTSQPVEVERWTGPDHEIDGVTFKASDVEVDLTEVGRFAGHIGVAFVRAYIEGDEDLEALTQAPSLASLAPRIAHARARVLAGLPAVRVAA
ncbi:hypothetical protein F8S13_08070 [Chloroflexia bacterium SDU3-3]|nr:hypothetical protein F8S13_08070 [Chloroflexia bacterium SDU3-3]